MPSLCARLLCTCLFARVSACCTSLCSRSRSVAHGRPRTHPVTALMPATALDAFATYPATSFAGTVWPAAAEVGRPPPPPRFAFPGGPSPPGGVAAYDSRAEVIRFMETVPLTHAASPGALPPGTDLPLDAMAGAPPPGAFSTLPDVVADPPPPGAASTIPNMMADSPADLPLPGAAFTIPNMMADSPADFPLPGAASTIPNMMAISPPPGAGETFDSQPPSPSYSPHPSPDPEGHAPSPPGSGGASPSPPQPPSDAGPVEDPPQTEDAETDRELWVVDARENLGEGPWAPTGLYFGTWFEPDHLSTEIGVDASVLGASGLRDVQEACDELGLRGVMNFYGPHDCGHLRSGQKFDPWFGYPIPGTASEWDAIACMLRDEALLRDDALGRDSWVQHTVLLQAVPENLVYDRALRLAAAAEAQLQEVFSRTMPSFDAIMTWTWSALQGDGAPLGADNFAVMRIVNHFFRSLACPVEAGRAPLSPASYPGSSTAHRHTRSVS